MLSNEQVLALWNASGILRAIPVDAKHAGFVRAVEKLARLDALQDAVNAARHGETTAMNNGDTQHTMMFRGVALILENFLAQERANQSEGGEIVLHS